jgi:prepilin-type N-terminal cleavage/methylation domain-containing protein
MNSFRDRGVLSFGRLRAGFTIVEILVVIGIVTLLAAILIPTMGAAQAAAKKAKTRVQFNEWSAAIESFRNEYGCYPVFDSSNLVNGGATPDSATDHLFHDLLAARKRNGSAINASGPLSAGGQNRKRVSFYSFSAGELTGADSAAPNLLCDASGNTEIAVLVDRNLDGVVNSSDFTGDLPAVNGLRPTSADFPSTGVRSGVVFYSAAPEANASSPAFVFSWK